MCAIAKIVVVLLVTEPKVTATSNSKAPPVKWAEAEGVSSSRRKGSLMVEKGSPKFMSWISTKEEDEKVMGGSEEEEEEKCW